MRDVITKYRHLSLAGRNLRISPAYDIMVLSANQYIQFDSVQWIMHIDLLHKSHNAPVPNPTVHHFMTVMCMCASSSSIIIIYIIIIIMIIMTIIYTWQKSKVHITRFLCGGSSCLLHPLYRVLMDKTCMVLLQYKDNLSMYRDSQFKVKTIRLSYYYDGGHSYTSKIASVYILKCPRYYKYCQPFPYEGVTLPVWEFSWLS